MDRTGTSPFKKVRRVRHCKLMQHVQHGQTEQRVAWGGGGVAGDVIMAKYKMVPPGVLPGFGTR